MKTLLLLALVAVGLSQIKPDPNPDPNQTLNLAADLFQAPKLAQAANLYAQFKRVFKTKKDTSKSDSKPEQIPDPDPAEQAFRLLNFQKSIQEIVAHNSDGKSSYTIGINQFSDLTLGEFKQNILTRFASKRANSNVNAPYTAVAAAVNIDWTTKAGVTPVKNQGNCGSCWAFAVVGNIESSFLVGKKKTYDLSEQQLVDCSTNYGNMGCNGGMEEWGYRYVKENNITTELIYPYVARDQACKKSGGSYTVKTYNFASSCSSLATQIMVKPLSVAVDATYWGSYKKGIFNKCNNKTSSLNHAVLLVGANSTTWKIKNSWGIGWGQSGFIFLAGGNNNTCGVCLEPLYITVA